MAVDLLALKAECASSTNNPEEADLIFNHLVEQLASTDLCAYGLYVHGRIPTLRSLALSRHGYLWATMLEQHSQLLLVCPPEHGKTTFMRWHIEQWIGQQTELSFAAPDTHQSPTALLVMNTADQAEKQCKTIAATFETNQNFKRLFPHLKPNPKWGWTADKLYCHRPSQGTAQPDPTLQATGIFGPIQGARVGLAVVDDPTDQQDASSDKTLEKQKEWHQGTLDDRILEGGLRRDILTRWSRKDIAQMLQSSTSWKSVTLPAIGQLPADLQDPIFPDTYPDYPWGEELWPEQWPLERLERKRREKLMVRDSALWQLAYMCNPVQTEGNLFKRDWFRYETPSLPWQEAEPAAA